MKIIALGVAAATGAFLLAGPAHAAGCNGHVNPAEWGCAPWDNNNGPQFPHYKKPATQQAPAQVKQQPRQPQPTRTPPTVIGNQGGAGIVAQGGGNIISHGGAGIVSQGGGNTVSQGGGNLQPGSHR